MALLLRNSGLVFKEAPSNPTGFTRLECYALLECTMIQCVPMPDGRLMIVDEESKLKPRPIINRRATELSGGHVIVGHALICSRTEFN